MDPMNSLLELCWPEQQAGEAISALVRRTGLSTKSADIANPPARCGQFDRYTWSRWIASRVASMDVEAEEVDFSYAELDVFLRQAGPALLKVTCQETHRFIALIKSSRNKIALLGPSLRVHWVTLVKLGRLLSEHLEHPLEPELQRIMDLADVPKTHGRRIRDALLRERLRNAHIGGCWILRLTPAANMWRQARHTSIARYLSIYFASQIAQYVLLLLSWWLVGQGAFQDRFEPGLLVAWGLLLLTIVPFRAAATWSGGLVAIRAGAFLKQALLTGALRLNHDNIRHQGAGELLGRVIESDAIESLALNGGMLALAAVIELFGSALVVSFGVAAIPHVALLLGCAIATFIAGWTYFHRRREWTDARLELTHGLVERLVGHRTRLAQESAGRWHEHEDCALEEYLRRSARVDHSAALQSLIPRAWLIAGFIGLAPAFIDGGAAPAAIAVSLGGVLLAYRAFQKLTTVLQSLVGAAVAWQQVEPIFKAARTTHAVHTTTLELTRDSTTAPGGRPTAIEAADITFRYKTTGDFVLRGCSLQIKHGDRILLEGPSGGGKSTFASVIAGLRAPESGLLLAGGLDLPSIGQEGWRRHVVSAPQFHENHVCGTFGFNLLMGGHWPPRAGDFERAATICRELGLGELLERMPSGLLQMVGDMGWQLSHGERSRLYIARALLQDAEVIVLDESFAALDPETLETCMQCVLRRAPSLLVIAHP
jgi:ATP-binding cassette subfamily B protein